MIGKLARRLGFRPSVPIALIDDWVTPIADRLPVELAPREGPAACHVDQFGRVQVDGATWILELTLHAGARWVPVGVSDRVTQRLASPGVLETTIVAPSGPVVQRIAAGVVDGEPVAVVEVENAGSVAIAAGLVIRPLRHDGRGHIGSAHVDGQGMSVDGRRAVRFHTAPAAVKATDGPTGDLLGSMPDPDDGTRVASASCRSGGAQAAAVWPVPHTRTLSVVIELGRPTAADAAVPSTTDINRGWQAHLRQGLRVEVGDLPVGEHLAGAARLLLTSWPGAAEAPSAILALSELGFGRDAARLFPLLERCDDDRALLLAAARWAELGDPAAQPADLDTVLGPIARAIHVVSNAASAADGTIAGPGWLGSALTALGGRLYQIEQPDVADRVHGLGAEPGSSGSAVELLTELTRARDDRGMWPDANLASAARFVRAVRAVVADDRGGHVALLPEIPESWRGRPIDVFGLPLADGSLSFGLRWHGPRPALLWEADLRPDAPFRVSVPGIDAGFSSTDRQGEALLADPGWQR